MLKKLDASGVEPVTKAAISLMLLTGLRDHSLRGLPGARSISIRWYGRCPQSG